MSAPLTLYLVRHGEVYNPEGILYGRMPGYKLSEAGRKQAEAAAEYLKAVQLAAIYSSPLERAQETARILEAGQSGQIRIQTDQRLIEVHTPYEGKELEKLEQMNFDLYAGNEPPYEVVRDVRMRVVDFVQSLRQKYPDQAVAAVSHGDIVVTMFMHAHEQDENDIGRTRTQPSRLESLGLPEYYPATASISRLTYETDDPDEVPSYHYVRPYNV